MSCLNNTEDSSVPAGKEATNGQSALKGKVSCWALNHKVPQRRAKFPKKLSAPNIGQSASNSKGKVPRRSKFPKVSKSEGWSMESIHQHNFSKPFAWAPN